MSDALVLKLNELGYQPVFLPRTGVLPPELYAYSAPNKRLVRYGPLKDYLVAPRVVKPKSAKLGNIGYTYTSSKKTGATLKFLEKALQCIGITSPPKLDLRFAGSKDYSFSFSNVTMQSVDPSVIKDLIATFTTTGLPAEHVERGQLHIAYEYAYANELLMCRGDKQDFAMDISEKVGDYVDVGVSGAVTMASKSTISFSGKSGEAAAFAYKAGRLVLEGTHWVFEPEVISRKGLVEQSSAYLPQPEYVLSVEE